ncbi:MAG: acyl-CoA thioesterase [Methanobacteriaceae archaeon]|nr:acyl-CoA thioesterase [Methanobacteriaceae archaeon]
MFTITVEPRFGEIDGLKHVNNNVIGNWFELGRNDIFRYFTPDLNLDYENWKLIMVRTEYDFLGQIFYGKEVEIRSFITKIGNSSFTTGHEAWQNNELKAKGKSVIVHYDFIEQNPVNIPDDIRKNLEQHLIYEDEGV